MNTTLHDTLHLPKKRVFAKPVSIWKRIAGLIIDLFLIYVLFLTPIMTLAAGPYLELLPATVSQAMTAEIPIQIYLAFGLFILLAFLYFSLMEYYLRQTLGMRLMGVYCDGKITFGKTLLRNLFIIPVFPCYLLWVIEPLHLLFYGNRLMESITRTRDIEFFEAY